jgi:hypothetical protein
MGIGRKEEPLRRLQIRWRNLRSARVELRAKENPPIGEKGGSVSSSSQLWNVPIERFHSVYSTSLNPDNPAVTTCIQNLLVGLWVFWQIAFVFRLMWDIAPNRQ